MKILLHSNQFGLGGSEIALWDYAIGCETVLRHKVIVAAGRVDDDRVFHKFMKRFPTILYSSREELNARAKLEGVDVSYFITDGRREGFVPVAGTKNVVHAVFPFYDPHGDVYAYVSEWASAAACSGIAPWVPHIVRPLGMGGSIRKVLGIPEEATVFGCYGRKTQFNITFVRDAVKTVSSNPSIYFLFMNFDKFVDRGNVIFLPGTVEDEGKASFIDTCDAMLHGGIEGETFGLAIAEFSSRNKPILAYNNPRFWAHMRMLGDKAIIYKDYSSLVELLLGFKKDKDKDWNAYREYTPEKVMEKFDKVFLR